MAVFEILRKVWKYLLDLLQKSESNGVRDYLEECRKIIGPQKQKRNTCYANAIAAVIYLATRRIIGRNGGYPEFETLRDQITQQYGENGADTQKVLEAVCPDYRLQVRSVKAQGAFRAIAKKCPVIAIFSLTKAEWKQFEEFYREKPEDTLTKEHINIANRQPGEATVGHAVFLVHFTRKYLLFVNSWGEDWANKGLFKVETADVLGFEFFDVQWKTKELLPEEREAWQLCKGGLRDILARADLMDDYLATAVLKSQARKTTYHSSTSTESGGDCQ